MGTWAEGPFDNDTAADWCDDLDDAPAPARLERIRAALIAAVDGDGYLEETVACNAIAAAALVASQRPGGAELVRTPYAPDFLNAGSGSIDLPSGLADLARQALERVASSDSEWLELWKTADDGGVRALGHIRTIRELLVEAGTVLPF